jgi:hypothetical protein
MFNAMLARGNSINGTQENETMMHPVRLPGLLVALVLLLAGAGLTAVPAGARTVSPVWNVTQQTAPTHLVPGGSGAISVLVANLGAVASDGTVTVTAQLPSGTTATGWINQVGAGWDCPGIAGATVVSCTVTIGNMTTFGPEVLAHDSALPLTIEVSVDPAATGSATSTVTVSGGGGSDDTSNADVVFSDEPAPFGIAAFSGWATDLDGNAAKQAGSHPDITTDLEFTTVERDGRVGPVQNVKRVSVDLPAGLIGNPTATATCSRQVIADRNDPKCPTESQVGTVNLLTNNGLRFPVVNQSRPLFSIDPPKGVPAAFAFSLNGVVTTIYPNVRAGGGYNVRADLSGIAQSVATTGSTITLWGVPADRSHDALRWDPTTTLLGAQSHAPRRALLTAPTSCPGSPLVTRVSAESWQPRSPVVSSAFSTDFDGDPIVSEGCDKLAFTPTVTATPGSTQPDAPTGLDVEIQSPQNIDNPDGFASAQLRDVKVTLPEGMTVNPGGADGLAACSDAQLGLGNDEAAACPEASKIGTVTAVTPLLEQPLLGGVYIRSQVSDDPESGQMFRLALVLENPDRGIRVKLGGAIRVNKDTGRITTEFHDNPQVPVEKISLHLKSGPRAALATPQSCGTKTIETELTSWAGHDVKTKNTFNVDCAAGLGGFAPALTAGTTNPTGGVFSPFALSITKPDGNADLTGLKMELPSGLLAQLKGNLGTQVGTVEAFAGPGSNPFVLPGQVYLEGAYGDAPFSLKVVVPAKAGPFDLGEVVVRQKIYVDPIDAHVTVVSDQVPTIVKGVPVRLQRLDVEVDKAGFIINPTSCAPKAFGGTLSAAGGQSAPVNVRFQVGDCANLALKPGLALSLSGKGQTTDGKHPAVTATLTQPFGGQANLKKVRVALPLSLALDPDNANGLCEFVDGSKVTPTCPKSSIVGTATAVTPILDESLSGPVYFVKNVRRDPKSGREIKTLPKLVIPLTGQNGVKLTLTGTSEVDDEQLVTTFDNIPDAPVSSFKLNIIGGKGGILAVSGADICKATQIADQQVDGQNAKRADTDVFIQTPSCPLKVLSKKVGKSSVAIKVGGLGAGKITVTGKGIKKTTKTISKSTVVTITAKRTKNSPGKVTVSFDPAGPAKARKTTK